MGEKQNLNKELLDFTNPESAQPSPERLKELEQMSQEALKNPAEDIETARRTIEQQAISEENLSINKHRPEQQEPTYHHMTKELKNETYRATLRQVQQKLSPTQQKVSRFIHQPFIETISDVGAKTLARPSGILGGGLVALLGSLVILIIARKIGFGVPPSIFAALFIIGFVTGLIFEIIIKSIHKLSSRKSKF